MTEIDFIKLILEIVPYSHWLTMLSWSQVLGWTLIYLWAFWGVYVLVMGIYRAHLGKKLTRIGYVLAAPWVIIGLFMDVFANIFIASFVFGERPKEFLVTTRLIRYQTSEESTTRQREWAKWICDNMLDMFDPSGNHC